VAAARQEEGVADVQTFGERTHVRFAAVASGEAVSRVAARLSAAGVEVRSVREVPPSLEDVFIARLQHEAATPREAFGPRIRESSARTDP
jgi:Domain of unknown function (DUF4162)